MKRWLAYIFLALAGLTCGLAVGLINTAFVPKCGEDCSAERLGSGICWGLALLLAFPAIGALLFKKFGGGLKRTAVIIAFLSAATTVPAVAVYGYELHQRYWKTAWRSDIPNVDFSHMAIATRPVQAMLLDTRSNVQVKAWERCALGNATCNEPHGRTVEAKCLGSGATVLIDEKDWPAFQRIQEEDLQGIGNVPRDMRLCAAWLQ